MQSNENQISSLIENLVNLDQQPNAKPIDVMREPIRITVDEWAAKARDKTECYRMVAHENGAYLPHIDTVTIWYLRDLAAGKKKMIKDTEIKHLSIP